MPTMTGATARVTTKISMRMRAMKVAFGETRTAVHVGTITIARSRAINVMNGDPNVHRPKTAGVLPSASPSTWINMRRTTKRSDLLVLEKVRAVESDEIALALHRLRVPIVPCITTKLGAIGRHANAEVAMSQETTQNGMSAIATATGIETGIERKTETEIETEMAMNGDTASGLDAIDPAHARLAATATHHPATPIPSQLLLQRLYFQALCIQSYLPASTRAGGAPLVLQSERFPLDPKRIASGGVVANRIVAVGMGRGARRFVEIEMMADLRHRLSLTKTRILWSAKRGIGKDL